MTTYDIALRPDPRTTAAGALAWQRTDTVGTELAFWPAAGPAAEGTAVVTGAPAYVAQWRAELEPDSAVRSLTVTCRGGDWTRTLRLDRDENGWSCRTGETGDLGPAQPLPGIEDPARLHADAMPRLATSPLFLSWAVRRLGLTPESGPVKAPTLRILLPSLAVLPGTATYHLLTPRRLRVTGDEPATTYDLDDAGIVTYQPGRLRLAH